MDERITIVGRPTYVATFSGYQEAAPILAKLGEMSYPDEDITILMQPAGTDAAIDLRGTANAAGQDMDAQHFLAEHSEAALRDGKTMVLLHPDAAQLEAVRAALSALGAQEHEYAAESHYSGADSERDVVQATIANVEPLTSSEPAAPAAPDAPDAPDAASAAALTPPVAASQPSAPDEPPASALPPPVDTSDLRATIDHLEQEVAHVRQDLDSRE